MTSYAVEHTFGAHTSKHQGIERPRSTLYGVYKDIGKASSQH
jgi:hypothetical protein